MSPSVSDFVLRARQLDIEATQHLATRVGLAEAIGQLVHALQRERGFSGVFLASAGARFAAERLAAMEEARPIEARLRTLFADQLGGGQAAGSRTLSLMAWVLLDLDSLRALRAAIDQRAPSARDAVAGYSRLIAGLVELIFHLADAAPDPVISRLLVALVHLVQGKESAGQERALGAQLLASGVCVESEQLRIVHLIEAQERSLAVFAEFAEPAMRERWEQHQLTPTVAQLERMRRGLCTARPGAALEPAQSEPWFMATSARMGEMWAIEAALVGRLREVCEARMDSARRELQDSEGLLRRLRENPPPHAHAVDRFFDPDAPVEPAPLRAASAGQPAEAMAPAVITSLKGLLQQQSTRLARVEMELDTARRTLHERKVIERAKGALMSRLGWTEEAAFRALQKASMDSNRRLVDVAEATLSLSDLLVPGRSDR